jgi:hypothetical protein
MRFNRFRVCLLFLTIVFVVFWVLMLQLSPLWSQSPSASPSLALESPESLHVFLKEPLHVFLRDGVHLVMETNYWLKLLEQLQRPLIIHPPQDQNFCSNSVIVAFDASSFADKIKAMKLRAVGLLHYGDERGFRFSLFFFFFWGTFLGFTIFCSAKRRASIITSLILCSERTICRSCLRLL